MIAKLKGLLDTIGIDEVVIDVGGVGYLVFCSARTLRSFERVGAPITILVETHVREDHINLYGFAEAGERDWFRLLTSVQGVGAKVALAILSAIGSEELIQAVAAQDKTVVSRANGVGPKLAGRIVLELKDKVGGLVPSGLSASVRGAPSSGDESEDAISALVNLGFQRTDAFGAVVRAAEKIGEKAGVDDLIRVGLQELS